MVPAGALIIENRGQFKCRSGCPYYGTSLVCPPHAPRAEEFRAVVREYSRALLVRFQTSARAGTEVASSLLRVQADPDTSPDLRNELERFFSGYGTDSYQFHCAMLTLERAAFLAGYPFSVALMPGPCPLCKTCSGLDGPCVHPTMRRYPADALGVNVIRTAKLAGMDLTFPFQGSPASIGILLID